MMVKPSHWQWSNAICNKQIIRIHYALWPGSWCMLAWLCERKSTNTRSVAQWTASHQRINGTIYILLCKFLQFNFFLFFFFVFVVKQTETRNRGPWMISILSLRLCGAHFFLLLFVGWCFTILSIRTWLLPCHPCVLCIWAYFYFYLLLWAASLRCNKIQKREREKKIEYTNTSVCSGCWHCCLDSAEWKFRNRRESILFLFLFLSWSKRRNEITSAPTPNIDPILFSN